MSEDQYRPIAGRSWVPLSPDQVRRRTFRESQLGRRGYRREDVDAFLARVADEIAQWSEAHTLVNGEMHRLRNYFRDHGIDAESTPTRSRGVSAEAVGMMAKAQVHADQLIANAQAHARAMQYDARDHAQSIITQARQDADRAAQQYRAQAGPQYTPDREQAERLASLGRTILAALNGATTQMDGASAQMRAISEAFAAELTKAVEPTGAHPARDPFSSDAPR